MGQAPLSLKIVQLLGPDPSFLHSTFSQCLQRIAWNYLSSLLSENMFFRLIPLDMM